MTWWYNSESGALTSAGSVQSFLQLVQGDVGLGAGWHELPIAATATEAQAAAEARQLYPAGAAPTTSTATQAANTVSQEAGGLLGSIPGLSQLGSFLAAVGQASTWERVAEVLIGAALIVAGAAHLLDVRLPAAVPVPV